MFTRHNCRLKSQITQFLTNLDAKVVKKMSINATKALDKVILADR